MSRKRDDAESLRGKLRSAQTMLARERGRNDSLAAQVQVYEDLVGAIVDKIGGVPDAVKAEVARLVEEAAARIETLGAVVPVAEQHSAGTGAGAASGDGQAAQAAAGEKA